MTLRNLVIVHPKLMEHFHKIARRRTAPDPRDNFECYTD